MLDRLAGLETEYAIGCHSARAASVKVRFYQRIVTALRRRIPAAQAHHFKEGVFLATGGAVWYEEGLAANQGMIEGATPECRGPRQLLAWQRAQDRLLSEASQTSAGAGRFWLLKNDRDSQGNVYGAQENYQCEVAEGGGLWLWRGGLVALLPAAAIAWLNVPLILLLLVGYLLVAGLLFVPLCVVSSDRRRLAISLFGGDLVEGRPTGRAMPRWLECVIRGIRCALTLPLAAGLWLLCKLVAFRRQRAGLTPFLVSRSVIAGAGHLDAAGHFWLSDKAPGINCMMGLGGLLGDRPAFVMGHFFKSYFESSFSWRGLCELWPSSQRLQIGLGDSNMCEIAEYLRIGTTWLVLDVLEAGELTGIPRIRQPVRGIRRLSRDAGLTAEVKCSDGRRYSALELQRMYADACRRHLERRPDAPSEAWEILHLWEEQLELLVEHKQLAAGPAPPAAPQRLFGSLDWATKLKLLRRAADQPWEVRKKIDLRYHELTPEGYYEMLRAAGLTRNLLSSEEVERAMRLPPAQSPALTRGYYVREFAQPGAHVSVNWRTVFIGNGFRPKTIQLRHYGRPAGAARPPKLVRLEGHRRDDE